MRSLVLVLLLFLPFPSIFGHFLVKKVDALVLEDFPFSQETNWPDETEMRERLFNITNEKFSHGYHHHSDESRIARRKRDGGIVSGPIATAVVTGMIGKSSFLHLLLHIASCHNITRGCNRPRNLCSKVN